ncbi:adenylate/guanylate cyclase domain-containing protein [Shimia sediminis]|uniref:adenylate/guanylate cyclase domain-containing protein n=1 Tax=Shimia sediminis TaxID=2497945 RepID=UPI000F8E4BD7|nr:adenylate/guanylate cyclase domain-containing protein [Shimia sediminis]
MTRRSPELEALAQRFATAMLSAEGDTVVNFLSAEDPLVFCGSAYGEVWQGDFLRDSYADHVNEFPNPKSVNHEVTAYENGDTGWALWTGTVVLPTNGTEIEMHLSLNFVMEKGFWKVQLIHNSVAISNIEVLGYEHSAITNLLEALENEPHDIGQTGNATLLFTDIVNSTALAEALGDRQWAAIVHEHLEDVSTSITRHSGTLVKSLGDGTMSSFPSASAAMTAAMELQRLLAAKTAEPRLSIRAGIHTGDVIAADGDFFGTVVNKAARITETAQAGEIRVSDAAKLMVGTDPAYAFSDRAALRLKGLEGHHVVHLLKW